MCIKPCAEVHAVICVSFGMEVFVEVLSGALSEMYQNDKYTVCHVHLCNTIVFQGNQCYEEYFYTSV